MDSGSVLPPEFLLLGTNAGTLVANLRMQAFCYLPALVQTRGACLSLVEQQSETGGVLRGGAQFAFGASVDISRTKILYFGASLVVDANVGGSGVFALRPLGIVRLQGGETCAESTQGV
jgi:hypothetical protein